MNTITQDQIEQNVAKAKELRDNWDYFKARVAVCEKNYYNARENYLLLREAVPEDMENQLLDRVIECEVKYMERTEQCGRAMAAYVQFVTTHHIPFGAI